MNIRMACIETDLPGIVREINACNVTTGMIRDYRGRKIALALKVLVAVMPACTERGRFKPTMIHSMHPSWPLIIGWATSPSQVHISSSVGWRKLNGNNSPSLF